MIYVWTKYLSLSLKSHQNDTDNRKLFVTSAYMLGQIASHWSIMFQIGSQMLTKHVVPVCFILF